MATRGGGRDWVCGSAMLALLLSLIALNEHWTLAQESRDETDSAPRRERRGPPPPDERRDGEESRGGREGRGHDGFRGPGEPRGRDDGPGREGGRGFGGFGPPRFEGPTEARVEDKGFLFIDGEYIPPPYEIRHENEELTVNNRKLTCLPPPRDTSRGFFGPRPGDGSVRYWVGYLQSQLDQNYVVLSFADQPNVVFDTTSSYDLLKSFIAQGSRSVRQVTVRDQLPTTFDKKVWDQWIENFVAPGELEIRAAALTNSFEASQRKALNDIKAHRLMEKMAYPLTVSGMVMSVLAIGHLLGGRPHANHSTKGTDDSPEMIRALNWSIAFTVAFSLLDLTWTILALNTKSVSELNPIGSQFIHDPRNLAGFKVSVTFSCLALLWLLRKHKRAQVAAWWLCLVLTLVTCRWLLVDTLIVGAMDP